MGAAESWEKCVSSPVVIQLVKATICFIRLGSRTLYHVLAWLENLVAGLEWEGLNMQSNTVNVWHCIQSAVEAHGCASCMLTRHARPPCATHAM